MRAVRGRVVRHLEERSHAAGRAGPTRAARHRGARGGPDQGAVSSAGQRGHLRVAALAPCADPAPAPEGERVRGLPGPTTGAGGAQVPAGPAAPARELMPFAGRHVVLGVSGGIACYKSCTLARRLTEDGAVVDVVLTASAAEFVRPVTFEALTGRPVLTSLWERDRALAHIGLAKQPDLAILAPATAHLLARAAAAYARGADVLLVTGPSELPLPPGVTAHRVETTAEMQRAVGALVKQADVLIMAAAPADYRPTTASATKRSRGSGTLTLELEATPDILATLAQPRPRGVVGFALEAGGDGVARARKKLQDKALDFVILNDALEPGAGFEVATNRVTIIGKGGEPIELPLLTKRDVAEKILDAVEQALT